CVSCTVVLDAHDVTLPGSSMPNSRQLGHLFGREKAVHETTILSNKIVTMIQVIPWWLGAMSLSVCSRFTDVPCVDVHMMLHTNPESSIGIRYEHDAK
ncbi:MAG: hypothetical protein AAF471_07755, partial [Myxococcota bacterium]